MEFSGHSVQSDQIQYRKHPLLGALVWVLNKSGVLRDDTDDEDEGNGGNSDGGGGGPMLYGGKGDKIGLPFDDDTGSTGSDGSNDQLTLEERRRKWEGKRRQSWSDDSGQNLVGEC